MTTTEIIKLYLEENRIPYRGSHYSYYMKISVGHSSQITASNYHTTFKLTMFGKHHDFDLQDPTCFDRLDTLLRFYTNPE